MLVDSHCHLQDRKFKGEQDAVIRRAREAGLTAMVCVGYDMESSRRAIDIANSHEMVSAAIGLPPPHAKPLRPQPIDEGGSADRRVDHLVRVGDVDGPAAA